MSAAAASPARRRQIGDNTRAEGQINKAIELIGELREINPEWVEERRTEMNGRWMVGTCTFNYVSAQITSMIDAKKASRRLAAVPNLPQVADGRYAVDHEGTLKFYRVTRKGGYKLFVYASDNQHLISNFGTMLAVLKLIQAAEADGTKAAQIRFGREFGRCYVCGRGLTRDHTRAAGIGDDCAAKA